MKKFISIIMTLSLCLSVTVPVSAKQIQSVTTEYTFAENATADTTFTGVATGSGEWSETISNYFSLYLSCLSLPYIQNLLNQQRNLLLILNEYLFQFLLYSRLL